MTLNKNGRYSIPSRIFLSLGIVLTLQTQSLHAQNIDLASSCGRALENFAWTNSYDLLTISQQFEVYKSRICSLNRENYQSFNSNAITVGLNVPIAKEIIGLDASHEQDAAVFQERVNFFCNSNFASYDRKDYFRANEQTVSGDLADSFKFCVDAQRQAFLAQRGAFVTIAPQGGLKTFTARLELRAPITPVAPEILTIAPEGAVDCTYNNERIGGGFKLEGYTATLTCTKDPTSEINLLIDTNMGTTQEAVVPAETGKVDELIDLVGNLQQQLAAFNASQGVENATLHSRISSTDGLAKEVKGENDHRWSLLSSHGGSRVDQLALWQGGSGETGFVECPPGHYLAALGVIDQDSGGFCVSCINGVRFICRSIGGH